MEQCPKCQSSLRIGKTFYTFENDDTPDNPTIAFVNMPMLCVNNVCENYVGKDMNNPKHVIETIRNKAN